MKGNKGITLIALIITIVVLLILAVVAIRAVSGNGIIAYAQNAATDYNQAQILESDRLQAYLNQLDDAQNKINNATNPEDSVKMIKFYLDFSDAGYENETGVKEYTAIEGMTWGDWFEDDTYTDGVILHSSSSYDMYVGFEDVSLYLQKISYEEYNNNGYVEDHAKIEDVIENGKTYYLWGC